MRTDAMRVPVRRAKPGVGVLAAPIPGRRSLFGLSTLVCPCGARPQIVSFITDPQIADRILLLRRMQASWTFPEHAAMQRA